MWRTKGAKQRVQSPQSHQDWGQIVCYSTLQGVISVLMMCLSTAASVWVNYQAGMDAYKRGDYKTAAQDYFLAQFKLGAMYKNGRGVAQNSSSRICGIISREYQVWR